MAHDGIRLLLIDDDEESRESLCEYLREVAEFEVTAFATGEEALDHLESAWSSYTAVLLDYVLQPGKMPGQEVLRAIQDRYPYLPVIAFTGLDPERGVQALAEGAYRYLGRPLNLTEMENIVRALVEQEAIFRRMAHEVRQLLGADMCIAWRLDRKGRRLRIAAWDGDRDLDAEYRRTTFLELDAPATQKLFQEKKPIFVRDVTGPRLAPHYAPRDYAEKQGWKSLISTPLVRRKQVIGLVDCYSRRELARKDAEHWLQEILPAFARQAAEAAWNAELSDRLQAIQGLNEVLAGTFEEETILEQILSKGIELVGAEAGWVFRFDVNKGKLLLKKSIGVGEEQVGKERELGARLCGHVARKGVAVNVPDVMVAEEEHQRLEIPGLEIRSALAVPLRRGEQSIGVMTVTSSYPRAFGGEDVGLLSSLASQAAVAIGQADVIRHSQELGRLALSGDFDALAAYVVAAARDLTGADVILWTMGEDEGERGEMLRVRAYRGDFEEGYPEKAGTPIADLPPDRADEHPSIPSLALARGKPLVRKDIFDEREAPDEPRFHNLDAAERHGWRAFMAVPLVTRGGLPLGSLSFYGRKTAQFGEAERDLMEAFAGQICIAWQSAVQQRMLRRLNEIGQNLSVVSASLEEVLTRIAELALEALEADTVDLYRYDPEQDRFDLPPIVAGERLHPEFVTKEVFADDVVVRVVKSKEPIFASNAQQHSTLAAGWETDRNGRPEHRFVIREKILSLAGIPLLIEGQVVGVLFVGYRRKRDFEADAELKERIHAFAYQAAIAINNARQVASIQERNRVMEYLLDVGPRIGNLVFPKTKAELSRIALSLCDRLKADSVVIYPFDLRREDLYWDMDNVASYGLWYPLTLADKPRERGLAARIREDGEVVIGNIAHEKPLEDYKPLQGENVRAFMGVALRHKGQDVGVLYANFRKPHTFSEQDKAAIREKAEEAAKVIVEADRGEGQTLPRLLETILSKAQSLLGADLIVLYRYHRGRDEEFVGRPVVVGDLVDSSRLRGKVPLRSGPYHLIEYGTYFADDVSEHEFYKTLPQGSPKFVEQEGIRSACGIVLEAEGEPVGVLFINYRKPHKFDEETKNLIDLFASQAAVAIRNARILEQTQALQEIAEQLNEFSLNPELIYGLILERALDLIGFSRGWLHLWNKSTDILEIKAAKGLARAQWQDVPLDTGIVGLVARTGRLWKANDVRVDPYYKEDFPDTRSELCVPIVYGGKVLGVLDVESSRQGAFSRRDEELLVTLASQAAIAINNAQVMEERKKESKALKLLHEIGQKINAEREVQPILDFVVPAALDLIGMDSGIIYLVDRETMQITGRYGYPEGFEHPEPRLASETGLTRTVLATGEPVVIENAAEDDRVNRVLVERGVRSMLAWPIQKGEERIGVLVLNGNRVRTFADWEKGLLNALSEQVAIAVENARLYGRLERVSERRIRFLESLDRAGGDLAEIESGG